MVEVEVDRGPPGAIVAACGLPVGAALFDAGGPVRDTGRFAALAIAPEAVLTWCLGDPGDPFDRLAAFAPEPIEPSDDWPRPLVACALAYDLGRVVERLPAHARAEGHLPDLWAARYRAVYVWDRRAERGRIFARDRAAIATLQRWWATPKATAVTRIGAATREQSQAEYDAAIERIQAHIRAGDVYQVNYALRISAPAQVADPAGLFGQLHARSPVPFAAALRIDARRAILSVSPERFLAWDGRGRIETRPIKGTRPRRSDPTADAAEVTDLQASAKDAAEHVMIVDLQRNDLGRICLPGSVRVRRLAGHEAYATVHHLVSVVEGRLRRPDDLAGMLRATFPGGSITGAPKISAMRIIDRLEPVRRGIYCGSVGYLDACGGGDLNIAIRTAVLVDDRLYYSAGGGIVADSDPRAEWAEAGHKARGFVEAIRSGGVTAD